MHYFATLSLNDRLLYEGQQYEITGITGRRVGMDVICEKVGA